MSKEQVSRRGFFSQAAGAVAVGAAGAVESVATSAAPAAPPPSRPRRVWVIVGINWEYNDEFCYEGGEFVERKVYFEEAQAKAECQRLCDAFFGQSPQDLKPCWEAYSVDPDTANWDDLRQAGFPNPYSVQELEV